MHKCFVVSYTKKSDVSRISYRYSMRGNAISVKSSIKDLGIIFDTKFSFTNHVITMCKSAFSVLGFIRRSGNVLNSISVLKSLYCSLVRSKLEFGSVVWNPFQFYLSSAIESVQKKFLRYLYFKQFGHYTTVVPYEELLSLYGLDSLDKRRRVAMLTCLHKLASGALDCETLLHKLQFNVPRHNSRSRFLFSPHYSRTKLGANSPLNSMMRIYNGLVSDPNIDLLNGSHIVFREYVFSILNN